MARKTRTNSVSLTKVVLYKHGMGYFERCGKITGPATVDLFCPSEAIDDMLKSLLVLNLGSGRAGTVTYDSSKTTDTRFAEFGFDIRQCRGLADMVAFLKGTPVKVSIAGQSVTARVLGADHVEQVIGDKIIKENQLVLFTGDGTIKRYNFSAITSLHIEDETIAGEIAQQLELLFDATKKKDKKRLRINVEGTANRELFIAYSIPCPIWKTSYRLVFVPDGTLLLQGMAIVDNVQDEDWNDVEMVLVSAAPISFIQPLYDPIQPARAIVAPQGFQSSGPVLAERAQQDQWSGTQMKARSVMPAALAKQAAPVASAYMAEQRWDGGSSLGDMIQGGFQAQSLPVDASASGELFEYKINKPVTIPHNSSALIPLVQQTIEGERISLYNTQKHSKHPYSTVRLKNTTSLTLESGPVTVMEEHAYAGEAMLDVLKPGDSRMLPYALDQSCHVIIRSDTSRKPVWRVRQAYGIIYMDFREQYKTIYQLENLSEEQKTVFVEHPVIPGMALTGKIKPEETSQSFHRFRVELKPGKRHDLEVTEESDVSLHIRLDNLEAVDSRQLDWLIQQNYVNKEFETFLKRLISERAEILSLYENRKTLEASVAQYKADQERARQNVKTLGSSNERYRQAIDDAEDRIVQDSQALNSLNKVISEKEKQLAELLRKEILSEIAGAREAGS